MLVYKEFFSSARAPTLVARKFYRVSFSCSNNIMLESLKEVKRDQRMLLVVDKRLQFNIFFCQNSTVKKESISVL